MYLWELCWAASLRCKELLGQVREGLALDLDYVHTVLLSLWKLILATVLVPMAAITTDTQPVTQLTLRQQCIILHFYS